MSEDLRLFEQPEDDDLLQYGVKRRSGRYPWGSGENPYQHSGDFLSRIEQMKKEGKSETEIAKEILPGDDEYSTTELRVLKSIANEERRSDLVATAKGLREKGYSLNEIAKKMGYANDSSVRSLLNEESAKRMEQSKVTAEYLKGIIDKKGIVDVGKGAELECGVSRTKMEEAIYRLELDGYERRGVGIPQATNPGKQTITYVLCKPGTEKGAEYDFGNIHSIQEYDKKLVNNGNDIRPKFEYPASMDSKRLTVRYAEDGGEAKDGIIELRRGVPDLSLGNSNYAQVRILVDGTHYLKGMAVYADDNDLPPGVDVRFNTNKHKGTPPLGADKNNTVLKKISSDPDNPFGSLIKENGGQSYYTDSNGKYTNHETGEKQSLSLINKRAEEGDWGEWADKLPSQFLGKQNKELIVKQLDLTKADKYAEYDEIVNLTNPTVKKNLLKSFADDCDAAAVHLKAAALPRQKYQVIIGLEGIKDNEVYAPNYNPGEKVALVRFPHEGTFTIPILTVNNKVPEGDKYIGKNAKDAVGISKKVADRLSGADFDGDTVMVIPTNSRIKISSRDQLPGLEGFDNKMEYGPNSPGSAGRKYRKMKDTQKQMGVISNLITDMTIRGANDNELARAVKHSMVVIDAEKHELDYKRSEKENGIAELKARYQGHIGDDGKYHEGAGTLLSRSKGEADVVKRQGTPKINTEFNLRTGKKNDWYDPNRPEGSLIYKNADDAEYIDKKTGKKKVRTQKSTQMAETDDARTLISDARHPKEQLYADYANEMKALANKARMEYLRTENVKYNPSAAKTYEPEVKRLKADLRIAEMNAPRERRAQALANSRAKAKIQSDPDLKKEEKKKIQNRELLKAREEVGAKRYSIDIDDRQWQAIQAGAISATTLEKILNHAKPERVRELATPRTRTQMSDQKIARIKALKASGYTNQEIANVIGCSSSTVTKYL